jgi:hypothetical protein
MKYKLQSGLVAILLMGGGVCNIQAHAAPLGFYGKFGLGYTTQEQENNVNNKEISSQISLNYTASGYGLEVGYHWLGSTALKGTIEWGYKTLFPLSNNLSVYGKISLIWEEKLKTPGFGVGIRYYLGPNILVDLAWGKQLFPAWLNKGNQPKDSIVLLLFSIGYHLA